MKNTKTGKRIGRRKILSVLLALLLALVCLLPSCKPKDDNAATLEGLFDENGTALSTEKYGEQGADVQNPEKEPQPLDVLGNGEEKGDDENDPDDENEKEEKDKDSTDTGKAGVSSPLPAAETDRIAKAYTEAEGFYYDILRQNFELDNMDTLSVVGEDGYENEYCRMIYGEVNSVEDLLDLYRRCFTDDFVDGIATEGTYLEKDGKLYCAPSGYGSSAKVISRSFEAYSGEGSDFLRIVTVFDTGTVTTDIPFVYSDGGYRFASVVNR